MTQYAEWFQDLAGKIFAGMSAHTDPAFTQFYEETGGLEDGDIFFLQLAYGFDPDPITPKHFIRRSPYGNPARYKAQMEGAVERGWLEAIGEGQYILSDKGRETAESFFNLNQKLLTEQESLPEDKIKRIAKLLRKVADHARALPEPADKWKWGLSWGSRFDRGDSAPPIMQLRRPLIDLYAYREDAHIAAWQPYSVNGQVWEVLTYVWRGEAGTAAELTEQLSEYRDYDEAAYAAALKELSGRGWVAKEDGKYVITEEGKRVRQEAEDTTDRYFYAAWSALDEAETKELKGLMKKLAHAVAPPEDESA
jgi:DNA-binding MarR family transcriptional regulator